MLVVMWINKQEIACSHAFTKAMHPRSLLCFQLNQIPRCTMLIRPLFSVQPSIASNRIYRASPRTYSKGN